MTLAETKVVVEDNIGSLLFGPLDSVVTNLQQLQLQYGKDYADLEISEADNPLDAEVVLRLYGVPKYSPETQQRLNTLRELLAQLPHEAAQSFLRQKP